MKDSGRNHAASRWLDDLRARFVRIAARRVSDGDVEDVVQEAMRVIAEKGLDRSDPVVDGLPPLAWCFQVLRNTIGNHYQRQRTRERWTQSDPGAVDRAGVIEAMDSGETLAVIEGALDDMKHRDPKCAHYLSRLADGAKPRELAGDEAIDVAVLSRRLYRCRAKLRDLLSAKGVMI